MPALFLHWGPGSNASMERLWFENRLPIHWWDQPDHFRDPATAMKETVDAALGELEKLLRKQGPVPLIAHSFGGQLAKAILQRRPDAVKSLTLLACGCHPPDSFVNLGHYFRNHAASIGQRELGEKLDSGLRDYQQAQDWPTFIALVMTIASIPQFMAHYFHVPAARERFFSLLPRAVPMNLDAFATLMQHSFVHPEPHPDCRSIPGMPEIPVRILLGSHDPLQNRDAEITNWKKWFPNARFAILEAGHFIHFETDPEVWAVPPVQER